MRSLLALPILVLAGACSVSADGAAADVKPSGVNGARSFDLSGFDSVELAGPDDVIVRVGAAPSVKAEGDTALLDQLEIEVVKGALEIRRKKNGWLNSSSHGKGVTITVTLPAIKGASIAGSGDMDVDTVAGDAFEASIAGSGSLKVGAVKVEKLEVSIAGSGSAEVGGAAGDIDVSIAGSGDLDAKALKARTADISIAGSGDVEAGVSEAAKVSIIGSGDVGILGGAKCSITKIGSGDVRCSPTPAGS